MLLTPLLPKNMRISFVVTVMLLGASKPHNSNQLNCPMAIRNLKRKYWLKADVLIAANKLYLMNSSWVSAIHIMHLLHKKMVRIFLLIISLNTIFLTSSAQFKYVLDGMVVDENNQPLAGVVVQIMPGARNFQTNNNGRFSINNLSKGTYTVKVSFIGYQAKTDTISINADKAYTVQLQLNSLNLQEVIVTDNHFHIRRKEEPLNIEIVNADFLKQNLGGSIMKSLERLPGVSTIDIGSGHSKPVIRGMGFNRVVIVENGIKHEAQQWGSDHGLEIDQYAVENLEVIKGPASLLYGSDAIGGVIDMNNRRVPAENIIKGSIDLTGRTNNDLVGGSVSLTGRKKWFYAGFRTTVLEYGDFKVPTDSIDIYSYRAPLYKNHLRNTAGNEHNLHFTFGMIKSEFQSRFFISNLNSKSGFFANAHGLEPRRVDTDLHDRSNRDIQYPYQNVNHLKIINSSNYTTDNYCIETNLGFQRNFRQEWSQYVPHGYMPPVFPDGMNFRPDLEREFEKHIYSFNSKLSYRKNHQTLFSLGVNSEYHNNRINGRGFIIPEFKQVNAGAFLYAKHSISERSIVQAGLRYDFGNISTSEYLDWFVSPVTENSDTTYLHLKRADVINRNFSNISWSAGYNLNLEKWSFKTNIGKSFRMPIAKELGANGVNYHQFSYEVGDSGLLPESSYQLDAGIEYNSDKFVAEITPFINYFNNYIYLNPTPGHDRLYGNGNQIFNYTQSDVFRYGFEIHSYCKLSKTLQLSFIGEYVYSEQLTGDKKGFSLPFSPPPSAIISAKYQRQQLHFLNTPYVSVDYKLTATQDKIVPPEEITKGYQIVNLRAGSRVRLYNQKADVSLQLLNLFNNRYFNHTNYYRLINVPEPARSFVINISVPFSASINN